MEITYLLLGILCFIAALYWDVRSDFKKWKKNIPIKHSSFKEMGARTLALTPSLVFLVVANFSIINIFIAMFMTAAWWWEFFDGWYNKIRGFAWRYNGSDDPDDASTDDILQGMSPSKQAILKWGLITLFTTLYIWKL